MLEVPHVVVGDPVTFIRWSRLAKWLPSWPPHYRFVRMLSYAEDVVKG